MSLKKYYAAKLDLACSARIEKPSLSLTAKSASVFLSNSILAFFRPAISLL